MPFPINYRPQGKIVRDMHVVLKRIRCEIANFGRMTLSNSALLAMFGSHFRLKKIHVGYLYGERVITSLFSVTFWYFSVEGALCSKALAVMISVWCLATRSLNDLYLLVCSE